MDCSISGFMCVYRVHVLKFRELKHPQLENAQNTSFFCFCEILRVSLSCSQVGDHCGAKNGAGSYECQKRQFPNTWEHKKNTQKNTTGFSELDVQKPKLHLLTSLEWLRLKET